MNAFTTFKRIRLLGSILLTLIVSPASFSSDRSCGRIEIAEMNWNSASFIAHVDQFILQNGFNCDAVFVPGNTQATGESLLEKSKPDIVPEFWSNSMKDRLTTAVTEGRITYAGSPFSEGAIEGFWVPEYMVQSNPEIAMIDGVIKNVTLFSKGSKPAPFYGCPEGWNCHISSKNLFKALKLEQAGFEFITAETGEDLTASLQQAYESKSPWFGYYWSPTAVLGKYRMTLVDFKTEANPEEFERCISKAGCMDPQVTMYPTPLVQTLVTSEFASQNPKAYEYLSRRGLSDAQMNEGSSLDGRNAGRW